MSGLSHNHRLKDGGPYDVAVVGGGASGLAAAIAASRAGACVCVLERDAAAGLPILATGNGRCNVSNAQLDPGRYSHPDVAHAVMGDCPERDVAEFFEGLGLLMAREGEGRLYPCTRRAESVRDVLIGGCRREGVSLRCGVELVGVQRFQGTTGRGGAWELTLREPAALSRQPRGHDFKSALRAARKALSAAPRTERTIRARSVIIACGGSCEKIAGLFGLPYLEETPVLCPIACTPITLDAGALASLDGLRVEAGCILLRDDAPVAHEEGEVLFRPYGVSGIAAFNLSRRIAAGDTLELDLFPRCALHELEALLSRRVDLLGNPESIGPGWLDGMVAPALSRALWDAHTAQAPSRTGDPAAIARALKHLAFAVTSVAEPQQAQVHRGGIPLDAIDLTTLAVRPPVAPALYACGEALDMDADCGGYNLAWAWLSGIRAGKEASRA